MADRLEIDGIQVICNKCELPLKRKKRYSDYLDYSECNCGISRINREGTDHTGKPSMRITINGR